MVSISWPCNPPASASQSAEITGMSHLTWPTFVFLIERGFHHVGQAGLKFWTSGDPPTSASQSARITGMSHSIQPWISNEYFKVNYDPVETFFESKSHSAPRLEYSGVISAHCAASGFKRFSCLSLLSSQDYLHHHAWLIFVCLVEMRFHHIGQAGLELLTSDDPPTSASQSARITGVSHRAGW